MHERGDEGAAGNVAGERPDGRHDLQLVVQVLEREVLGRAALLDAAHGGLDALSEVRKRLALLESDGKELVVRIEARIDPLLDVALLEGVPELLGVVRIVLGEALLVRRQHKHDIAGSLLSIDVKLLLALLLGGKVLCTGHRVGRARALARDDAPDASRAKGSGHVALEGGPVADDKLVKAAGGGIGRRHGG